ncbi:MAG: nuclear transport factor 2 family protein [Bacteroidota bacterium]
MKHPLTPLTLLTRLTRLTLLTTLTLLTFLTTSAQTKDEQAIRKILADQTVQWNKGNLDAFMNGYWKNDSLLFVGRTGPKYGYQTTLDNYKKNYPDTTVMGKLSFDILKVQPLSSDCYFVLGKFMLKRTIGDLSGYYTLLFRKINNHWVIVADHSS